MTMLERFPALRQLSGEEMVFLANELYSQAEFPLSDEQAAAIATVCEQRWQHYLAQPESVVPWEVTKEKMRKMREEWEEQKAAR